MSSHKPLNPEQKKALKEASEAHNRGVQAFVDKKLGDRADLIDKIGSIVPKFARSKWAPDFIRGEIIQSFEDGHTVYEFKWLGRTFGMLITKDK